jgi:hypothetical protein
MTQAEPITLLLKQIAELSGISRQAIEKKAKKEKWEFIERPGIGGTGMIRHYPLAALPSHIQALYHAQYMKVDETGSVEEPPRLPVPSDESGGTGTFSKQAVSNMVHPDLAAWQNRIAGARYDLCAAYLGKRTPLAGRRKARKARATSWAELRKTSARPTAPALYIRISWPSSAR